MEQGRHAVVSTCMLGKRPLGAGGEEGAHLARDSRVLSGHACRERKALAQVRRRQLERPQDRQVRQVQMMQPLRVVT